MSAILCRIITNKDYGKYHKPQMFGNAKREVSKLKFILAKKKKTKAKVYGIPLTLTSKFTEYLEDDDKAKSCTQLQPMIRRVLVLRLRLRTIAVTGIPAPNKHKRVSLLTALIGNDTCTNRCH